MRYRRFLMAAAVVMTAAGPGAAGADRLLDRLQVNHAAMLASEQDFHQRQQRGSLSASEESDYAAYVARLHRVVAEDCVAVVEAGLSPPPELGCPQRPVFLAPAAIDQARERTVDEQLAALDEELLGGLGEFDEMLLREQERVRAATPMTDLADAADAAGATDGRSGDAGSGDGSEQTPTTSGAQPGGGEANAGRAQGKGPGTGRQGRGQGVPPDIPDGSDDDVVARQLREAAEKETSPALKEKLWDEYRKYKAGTR